MNKRLRTVLLCAAVAVGVGAAIYGGLLLFRGGGAVKVFAVQDIGMTDFMDGGTETSGTVKADRLQTVYLTETQQGVEVLVTEGQQVKVGDTLLRYDTTLSDVAVQQAKIEAQKQQAQLDTAKRELEALQKQQPTAPALSDDTPQTVPLLLSGSGTKDDPWYYLWGAEASYDDAFLRSLLPAGAAEGWGVFLVRENNTKGGAVLESWGLHVKDTAGKITFDVYTPHLPSDEPGSNGEKGDTAAELAVKRGKKEQEVKKLTITAQIARVAYEKKQQEADSGTVVSKVSGVVTAVRNVTAVRQSGEAVVEISDGGGLYMEAACSEFDRGSVVLGQKVTIQSWENNGTYEGIVTTIGSEPVSGDSYYGGAAASYYPLTVQVDSSAKLREEESVRVLYQGVSGGLYLDNAFILSENGKSVVYVRSAEGRLEQRTVQTGKSAWGSYTQIRGGLTAEDFIAFPYGRNVRAGAKTAESTPDQLYSY